MPTFCHETLNPLNKKNIFFIVTIIIIPIKLKLNSNVYTKLIIHKRTKIRLHIQN